MEFPPSDYFIPCEPDKGVLVNGQYFRAKFGRSTLEMMVRDGVFNEVVDLSEELGISENKIEKLEVSIEEKEDEITGLNARIKQLIDQLEVNDIEPVPCSEESIPGECEEEGDSNG
jgi:hypothetical protein